MQETAPSVRPDSSLSRRLGQALVILLWGVAILLIGATLLEGFLKLRWDRQSHHKVSSDKTVYSRIARAYWPFAVQHINPFYLFYFPFDSARREAMNNSTCSIDSDGFRGAGPGEAGGRKLAFLLGGSAAFGHFSTSNSTTITGFLNQMQNEFLFVNAGVPSWNSYQELCRLANQILDFSPNLVVVYDGGNDAGLAFDYWRRGLGYPVGTPESFDELYALVGDIRGDLLYRPRDPLYERFFPRLTASIRFHLLGGRTKPRSPPLMEAKSVPPDSLTEASVERYVKNLTHMQSMTEATGARFIAIFQSLGDLHSSAPAKRQSAPYTQYERSFRDKAFSMPSALEEHLDFSTVFEEYQGATPWRGEPGHPDLDDQVIFVDGLHLSDRGNRFVAEKIRAYLNDTATSRRTE